VEGVPAAEPVVRGAGLGLADAYEVWGMSEFISFMLLCSAFGIDPLLGTREGPVDASMTIEANGKVRLEGFPNVRTFEATRWYADGFTLVINGVGTDMGFVAWGKLDEGPDGYQLSWFMPGEWTVNGGYTVAQIGVATCKVSNEGAAQ
jgi:hypothetical protein